MKKILYLFSIITFCSSSLLGCGQGQQGIEGQTVRDNQFEILEFRPDIPEERDKLRRRPGMVPEGETGQGTNTREDNITYHERYEGETVEAITHAVGQLHNVQDVRVVLHERTVLVGVVPENGHIETEQVRATVEKIVGNQDIRIVTDSEGFHRIRELDEELRLGRPFEEVGPQYRNLWRDFGRILQQPFEHNRYLN